MWLLTLFFASELGNRIKGFDPRGPWVPMAPWTLALLGAALVLGLIGYDRLAGATALAFVASVFADPARYDLTTRDRTALLVPVICFVALLLAPRRRQPDPRRLAWLVLVAALAVAAGTRAGDDTMALVGILPLLVLLIPVFALLRTDPRPAIAYTMWAAYFGVLIAQDPGSAGRARCLVPRRGAARGGDRGRAHPAPAGTHARLALPARHANVDSRAVDACPVRRVSP